jgi:hypothetical protein
VLGIGYASSEGVGGWGDAEEPGDALDVGVSEDSLISSLQLLVPSLGFSGYHGEVGHQHDYGMAYAFGRADDIRPCA